MSGYGVNQELSESRWWVHCKALMLDSRMPKYLELPSFIFFAGYCVLLLWCWTKWLRSKPTLVMGWRNVVLLVGLLCATVSATLNVYLYVHALYTGGYSFYHPIELMCIRWGTLTALLGVVAASVGTGQGRVLLGVISVLTLAIWLMDGMAQ